VLRLGHCPVVFYCHFPDQLLAARTSALKRLYRKPLDWFEEVTTGMATTLLVCCEACYVVHHLLQKLNSILWRGWAGEQRVYAGNVQGHVHIAAAYYARDFVPEPQF
jgi:hypothetical protein